MDDFSAIKSEKVMLKKQKVSAVSSLERKKILDLQKELANATVPKAIRLY